MSDLPAVTVRNLTGAQKTALCRALRDPDCRLPEMRADTRTRLLSKGLIAPTRSGGLALTNLGLNLAHTLAQQQQNRADPTYRAMLYDRIVQALAGRGISDAARITLADGQIVDIVCSSVFGESRTFTVRVSAARAVGGTRIAGATEVRNAAQTATRP